MRPQQQNRRMRGRNNNNNGGNNNNNNRKGPNPLTRNYESNGPDVKIRGSAQQIAEKYATLARDATSSGDRVMAENYLQHAEHYNRIIAAAQAQMPIQNFQQQRDDFDDDLDDEMDGQGGQNGGQGNGQSGQGDVQPQAQQNLGQGPQPEIEGVPAEVALNQDAASGERPRDNRQNGYQNGNGDGEDGPRRNRRRGRGRGRFDENRDADQPADGESDDAGLARILGGGAKSDDRPIVADVSASEPEATVESTKPIERPAPEPVAADVDPVG